MRKLYFIISLLLIVVLSACNNLEVYSGKPIYAMDTTINITLYNDPQAESHYSYIKTMFKEYSNLFDNYTSYKGEKNIYELKSEIHNKIAIY